MYWNKKHIVTVIVFAAAVGYVFGRVVSFQEMWRLRIRADENQYAAEFFQKAFSTNWAPSSLLERIPEKRLYIHGKKAYAQWLCTMLKSPRIVASPEEADAVLSFDPTSDYLDKHVYWLTELISKEE